MNYIYFIFLPEKRFRTKSNSKYSDLEDLLIGAPQEPVLGPLLFDIYTSDIFLFITELNIANNADDTTPYEHDTNLIKAQIKIEYESLKFFKWFRNNFLRANVTKSYFMLATGANSANKCQGQPHK